MSVQINSVEDHKAGSFYINICIDGKRHPRRFSSLVEALDCIAREKERCGLERAEVTLKQIVIMATKQWSYETCYSL